MSCELSLLLKSLPFLLKGAFVTIQISLMSIAIGFCGGVLLGVLNCRKLRFAPLAWLIGGFVWTIRGTPFFIQLFIVYYALPEILGFTLSPFTAGVVALGVNSIAYISEIVRGGIDSISDGQWEAAYVLGLKPWKTLKQVILPQMFRMTLPSFTNELTSLIKETGILMVIGVAELTKASKDIVARELDPMTIYLAAAALYLTMTSSLSLFARSKQKKWVV
jgi:His/Glu/Gln/Arg/opine family amino acid ABC transporter permease subunit